MAASDPVIIVGAGLAGLVAGFELAQRHVRTIFVDQESEASLGGQAYWSLGGLFIVNSAEQRRVGVQDSRELAMRDWFDTAGFDRGGELEDDKARDRASEGHSTDTASENGHGKGEDFWPRRWAEAFVHFATDEMEDYVKARGLGFLPTVSWAERGNGSAQGHGNSVPRFHMTWGTGPEVVRAFREPVQAAARDGLVEFKFRHVVDEIMLDGASGRAIGVRGRVLEEDPVPRGVPSSRKVAGRFELRGAAILIASGGIGGNLSAVKAAWPVDRMGPHAPERMVVGVPAHVDGRMMGIAEAIGAHIVNRDRMWHYTEGLQNWKPIWPGHGIRVIPAPSSLWLDATGRRLPPFLYPGTDTLSVLTHICRTGYDYSWYITDQTIVAREFALSGSEQNPDLTGKNIWQLLWTRLFGSKGTTPVQQFLEKGEDFVVEDTLEALVEGMNRLAAERKGPVLAYESIRATVEARDSEMDRAYSKDAQAMLVRNARAFWPDRLTRIAKPHRLLDAAHGPLVAVRMNVLTRKTLGGLETDLRANVRRAADGTPFPGLYAAGEAAGFGGGGVHGYRSLEGTFLGGCIFSGRTAGRAMADEVVPCS